MNLHKLIDKTLLTILNPKYLAIVGAGTATLAGGSCGIYYLSLDKTINDKIKRLGKTLIENSKQYQIAFKELKTDEQFIKDINKSEITNQSKEDVGGIALSAWCEEKLKLPISKENIDNFLPKVNLYCTKPPLTIGEKIERKGKQLLKTYNAKFKEIKSSSNNLQQDLTEIDSAVTDINQANQESKAISALEKWCSKSSSLDLLDEKAEEVWKKVETRCLEDKANKD